MLFELSSPEVLGGGGQCHKIERLKSFYTRLSSVLLRMSGPWYALHGRDSLCYACVGLVMLCMSGSCFACQCHVLCYECRSYDTLGYACPLPYYAMEVRAMLCFACQCPDLH